MSKIRLAMVRCDGHAYTYGPLLDRCDLSVYRENFHVQYYYMIHSYTPDRLRPAIVPGFRLTKVWDANPVEAQKLAHTFFDTPRVCDALEELTVDVDAVFINDCDGDGSDHVELASPFLKKGIPTFLDKPFANTLKNAKKLVALAKKHKTPLFSTSILGYVNEAAHLRRRCAQELHGAIQVGIVKGLQGYSEGKENLGAIIHGISLGLAVFGDEVDWVQCMGTHPLEYLLMHYQTNEEVLVVNSARKWSHEFRCEVFANSAGAPPRPYYLAATPVSELEFIDGAQNILKLFRKMVRTRQPVVSYETMLKPIAIVEAGRQAQKTGKRVYLKDLKDSNTT